MNVKPFALIASWALLVGCTGTSTESKVNEGEGAQAHAAAGPHGQPLIELGNEDYHAELVHDDAAGTVTIFILDSAGKEAVAIDATEVTLNLKHGETPEQFQLPAQPETTDPEGKSSKFVSDDSHLATHLDEEGDGELVVTIEGKPYRGKLTFEHDDAAHEGEDDHAEGEHDHAESESK